jgi:hypothetical protein
MNTKRNFIYSIIGGAIGGALYIVSFSIIKYGIWFKVFGLSNMIFQIILGIFIGGGIGIARKSTSETIYGILMGALGGTLADLIQNIERAETIFRRSSDVLLIMMGILGAVLGGLLGLGISILKNRMQKKDFFITIGSIFGALFGVAVAATSNIGHAMNSSTMSYPLLAAFICTGFGISKKSIKQIGWSIVIGLIIGMGMNFYLLVGFLLTGIIYQILKSDMGFGYGMVFIVANSIFGSLIGVGVCISQAIAEKNAKFPLKVV